MTGLRCLICGGTFEELMRFHQLYFDADGNVLEERERASVICLCGIRVVDVGED